jgi:hypothetical protein
MLRDPVNTTAHTIAHGAILFVIDRVMVEEISKCICGIISKKRFAPK